MQFSALHMIIGPQQHFVKKQLELRDKFPFQVQIAPQGKPPFIACFDHKELEGVFNYLGKQYNPNLGDIVAVVLRDADTLSAYLKHCLQKGCFDKSRPLMTTLDNNGRGATETV